MISKELTEKLQAMVGFRNTLVHQYQSLDIGIMVAVIEHRLVDFTDFTAAIIRFAKPAS